jgi:hypothetical protein
MKRSYFGGLRVKPGPTYVTFVIIRFQDFLPRFPDFNTLNASSSAMGRTWWERQRHTVLFCKTVTNTSRERRRQKDRKNKKSREKERGMGQHDVGGAHSTCLVVWHTHLWQWNFPLASLLLALLLDGIAQHLGTINLRMCTATHGIDWLLAGMLADGLACLLFPVTLFLPPPSPLSFRLFQCSRR